MLVITKGSKETVKKELKIAAKAKTDELKAIKKEYRKVQDRPRWVREKIKRLEELQRFYMVSKVLPVKVGNIIINYLAYEKFMKNIKGFPVRHVVGDAGLKVEYETPDKTKGSINFFDLNQHFSDFEHLPAAELEEKEALV
ncbi:hypothetical protein [Siminovitchia fortis]|uniref:hypothetical protein n=1 Tax=Siminovitchia fortis TaxID=254758 RepID=UPI00119F67A9|nr:hypothetical protein [Siminovitchia fortis]